MTVMSVNRWHITKMLGNTFLHQKISNLTYFIKYLALVLTLDVKFILI